VQSNARFTQDGKVRFYLAEPADRAGDPLAGLKFEANSQGGVAKEAFKVLHALGSGAFGRDRARGHVRAQAGRGGEALSAGSGQGRRDDPDRHGAGGRGGRGDLFRGGSGAGSKPTAPDHRWRAGEVTDAPSGGHGARWQGRGVTSSSRSVSLTTG